MRILVTGGRGYSNRNRLFAALDAIKNKHGISFVIQGGAKGADSLAKEWCKLSGVHSCQVDALWDSFGKAAGHRRNAAMLNLKPDACVACEGGAGTAGMIGMCEKAGIKVWKIDEDKT